MATRVVVVVDGSVWLQVGKNMTYRKQRLCRSNRSVREGREGGEGGREGGEGGGRGREGGRGEGEKEGLHT